MMQKWFAKRGVCCVVAGSLYPEIDLPFCDIDHRAICRHAAGVLIRLGHRRIGLLSYESIRAGDRDSQIGFLESAEAFRSRGISTEIACHRNDLGSVERALRRLRERRDPPTGIVVCGCYAYLAASSLLAKNGLVIPRDISLICRNDDVFMRFLAPAPARYILNPQTFAKDIFATIHRLTNGHKIARMKTHLFPRFVPNQSIGPPPAS